MQFQNALCNCHYITAHLWSQPIFYSDMIGRGPYQNNIHLDSSHWEIFNIKSIIVALWPLEKPLLYWLFNLRITKHVVLVRVRSDLNINLIIISISLILLLLATPRCTTPCTIQNKGVRFARSVFIVVLITGQRIFSIIRIVLFFEISPVAQERYPTQLL